MSNSRRTCEWNADDHNHATRATVGRVAGSVVVPPISCDTLMKLYCLLIVLVGVLGRIPCHSNCQLVPQSYPGLAHYGSLYEKLVSQALKEKAKGLSLEDKDILTVASALKHYLRALPEPLLTFRFYSNFLAAGGGFPPAMHMLLPCPSPDKVLSARRCCQHPFRILPAVMLLLCGTWSMVVCISPVVAWMAWMAHTSSTRAPHSRRFRLLPCVRRPRVEQRGCGPADAARCSQPAAPHQPQGCRDAV